MAFLLLAGALAAAHSSTTIHRPTWDELALVQPYLTARGISAATLARLLARTQAAHAARVREGDLDHLVFYMLQSTRFTPRPPIEPALSAKALVEGLEPEPRAAFLTGATSRDVTVPPAVQMRITDLMSSFERPSRDERSVFFSQLVQAAFPEGPGLAAAVGREYVRTMRFIYRKEFLAPRGAPGSAAVHDLYRERGLSTDTAVESGFVIHTGLAVLNALEPERRVRRVLVVGPGLDLAPRTGFLEESPPQSYQPWAVMDALVSLGLSRLDDLSVVAADINPRVVAHLRQVRKAPPSLWLASALADDAAVVVAPDYRDYFAQLGRAIGADAPASGLRKVVRVGAPSARALAAAETLDIVTERLAGPGFDLVIATNIFPYFDDLELALAMSNIASMTVPGGALLHNEGRPVLGEITTAVCLPFEQSRHVTIATVRGTTAPLADVVFLHRKATRR
ncbi:MAG: hypothetical protein H0V80_08780 [Acidobacteria bacterium]|nr:hypothetical protein [Acidobacteriota bacterium]